MANEPVELIVFDGSKSIFDGNTCYEIPLYQRAYAWGEKQLIELIDDINEVETNNYFIGTLIVAEHNGKYEVVDGQQRLTSLFLLLNCLGINIPNAQNLCFACRDKSNYTLKHVKEIFEEKKSGLDEGKLEENICSGIEIIRDKLHDPKIKNLQKKLGKVVLYRIEVPQNTDLNRYFEIMNTRGEQLELQDILKAKLMNFLNNENDRSIFATIWNACSDMTGYVQMHFDTALRDEIFDCSWQKIPKNDWKSYTTFAVKGENSTEGKLIDIIKPKFTIKKEDGFTDNGDRVRFESVIDFPFFLMHVLKVYLFLNPLHEKELNEDLVKNLLDDKRLIVNYDCVLDVVEKKHLQENFVKTFVLCLLRSRFLFDKYILKREFVNDSEDGEWSLKELHVSGKKSKRTPYYKKTRFVKDREWESTNDIRFQDNLMIQSALRVSYTSPKVMHWITELLKWLSKKNWENVGEDITGFNDVAEEIAKNAVNENFFSQCADDRYEMGVNTPHIVFNYLDYLLWKDNRDIYKDFVFEFRNSVEHWYPQRPEEQKWEDKDSFGNLCILQRDVNSKFSNKHPMSKKNDHAEKIANGSLKLRLMSEMTKSDDDWKERACALHEKEMIGLLKKACGIK